MLLRDGSETEPPAQSAGGSSLIQLNLLGMLGGGQGYLSFTAIQPFDAVQITQGGGLASLNGKLNVYAANVTDPIP